MREFSDWLAYIIGYAALIAPGVLILGWLIYAPANFVYKKYCHTEDFWRVWNEMKRQGKLRITNFKKVE